METLNDYVTKYPFPPLNIETIKKGIKTIYGIDDLNESEIETMLSAFFILNFDDIYKDIPKGEKVDILFNYAFAPINEPVCNSDYITGGDCTKCLSYFLCKQAPEVYQPNTKEIKED